MALRLKVKDGTRPDERLCDTCQYSLIQKGGQQGQETVMCNYGGWDPIRLAFPVVICNKYYRMGEMSEHTAEQIGWVLEVKAGKVMGFKPPKKEYENV